MTAFDKAWGVTKFRVPDKPSDEGRCDGTEGRQGCVGDGSLGDGGGYECSVCSESFCEDCVNVGHIPEEDKGLADAALDFARQNGSIYENMCSECELELLNEHIPEFKAHLKDVEDEMNERRIEERNEMDDFERRVDEQSFFGDNRGETLFSDTSPHLHSKFNPDWQDKMKSKDSFEMAWGVVKASPCCDRPRLIERQDGSTRCRTCQQSKVSKEAPTEECKGCGLAHGSPNSEYCSEICERQNMKKSDDMLRDALARKLPPRKEFSEKEIEAMMGRRVLPPRKDPEDDPLVHRARKNLMEERKNRRQ